MAFTESKLKSHSTMQDDALTQYVLTHSMREHPILKKLRLKSMEDYWNFIMVTREESQFLALIAKLINTKKAIEIGTYTGYNALSLALTMPEDGLVVACEIEEDLVNIGKPFWKEAGVEHKIDLRLQPALKTLDELLAAGEAETFDFIFIDADKENIDNYYEKSLQLVRKGGIVVVDNVLWDGLVLDAENADEECKCIHRLNQKIHKDSRVSITMLTVGDGVTLCVKL